MGVDTCQPLFEIFSVGLAKIGFSSSSFLFVIRQCFHLALYTCISCFLSLNKIADCHFLFARLFQWLKELLMSVVNLHQVRVTPWLVTKFASIVQGIASQSLHL